MKSHGPPIATTHTGSLPAPASWRDALASGNGAMTPEAVAAATGETVRRQRDIGLDLVNDGEVTKMSYAAYVVDRLTGFDGEDRTQWPTPPEVRDFPEWAARREDITRNLRRPACDGPISYRDTAAIEADIAALRAAAGDDDADLFMTAASPGVVTMFMPDQHFGDHEAYVYAVADAMKQEYDAIHAAGLVLQLDCPDLAAGRNVNHPDLPLDEWLRIATLHVEALNHATRDIPPEAMRMHVCWGNREAPHHRDVPLREIVDLLIRARPAGLSIEGANPRHEHEWQVFEDVRLPEGKMILAGVIDSTTNFVEHPELVAQRLRRYASVVGRENVVACTDCGFATLSTYMPVAPDVVWAKLESMVEGASLA